MKHIGNLDITSSNQNEFENLKEVTGNLHVYSSAKLDALETIGGNLSVYGSAKLDAPKLETIGGNLYVEGSAKLDAPKLETIGGDLNVYGSATLDALETIGGYLSVDGSVKLDALETIGGNLYVEGSAKLDAPKLETIGGDLNVEGSAKLDAPKLNKVVSGTDAAKIICAKALTASFKKKKLVKVDGILSWLISKKKIGSIITMKVKVVGQLKFSFIVQKGELYSHGKTIKEAKDSLKYKISSRDTSEFKKWKLDTVVTQEKMIQAYRAITGACEFGVKSFCEGKKIPKKLKVSDAIKLTQGSYGNDNFAEFFK